MAANASSCRWYLDPAPNAVFLTVVAPEASVTVSELFRTLTQSQRGAPVAGLGDQAWQGTSINDSVVMAKGNRVFTLTVEGQGSSAVASGTGMHQRLAITLLQLVADQV